MVSAIAEDAFEKRASRAGRRRRNETRYHAEFSAGLDEIEDESTRIMVRHMLGG